jgi:cytoskeletal protein CcmA (bactofilin family)
VQGTINASDRIEVQGTSIIIGDINTRALAVIAGGRINGSVRIADAKEPGSEEQMHPSPVAVLR